MLAKGHGFVSLAWRADQPVAAAVFLHHGREAVYKFGASDYAFQGLRPNNLVLWESMKKCATAGLTRLHLGRTSLHQEGLRRFKLGFGAVEEQVDYFKYDFRKQAFVDGCRLRDKPVDGGTEHACRFRFCGWWVSSSILILRDAWRPCSAASHETNYRSLNV